MMPGWVALLMAVVTAWFCLRYLPNQRGVIVFLIMVAFLTYIQNSDNDPDCVDYGHAARVC